MAVGWTTRTTAALGVAVAVLSGCSEEQPANDTMPEPSTETSESTEALPPLGPPDFPVPDEAREQTPEGALEFTRYYIGLGPKIGEGAINAHVLMDLSEGCALCRQVASSYEEDQVAGNRYQGFSYSFQEYGPPLLRGVIAEVGFVYSQSAYQVVNAQGQALPERQVPPTGDLQSGAVLEWRQDRVGWVVTSLTIG